MAKIIEFENVESGRAITVTTTAGIYCGDFSDYATTNGETVMLLENCKLYPLNPTLNSNYFINLKNTAIFVRQVVSLTFGTIQP